MKIDPDRPSKVFLEPGESVWLEPGAMLAFQNCTMKTQWVTGSIFAKCRQYLQGGEHLFRNQFQATDDDAWVSIEEQMPGQIRTETVKAGEPALMIRRGAYLGHTDKVQFETKWLGTAGALKGKGMAVLKASAKEGEGTVFFHTHGSIVEKISVDPELGPVIVDNDMILAYSENLESSVRRPGKGAGSFLCSSEGLVTEFKGKGVVYVASGQQTGSDNLVTGVFKEASQKIGDYLAMGIVASVPVGYYWLTRGVNPFDVVSAVLHAYLKKD